MIKFIKRLFRICDHKWTVFNAELVHYPDYEPVKIGIEEKCIKCNKYRKCTIEPYKHKELFRILQKRKETK